VAALGLDVAAYGLLALAVLGWALALLCVGAAVAMLVRSHAELSAVTDIGSLLLTCLGGALVPLAAMPGWARAIAPVSPGYWATRGLRGALTGDTPTTLVSVAILIGVATAAAGIAALRLSRGWGRGRLL
jgi:ABC-2 type transport system permease protein